MPEYLCYKMEIRLDHRKRDSAWFRFEGANTENRPLCVEHIRRKEGALLCSVRKR